MPSVVHDDAIRHIVVHLHVLKLCFSEVVRAEILKVGMLLNCTLDKDKHGVHSRSFLGGVLLLLLVPLYKHWTIVFSALYVL